MSVAEKIKTFNSILEDLLKQLEPKIGSTYHTYFVKYIKYNYVYPIQQFLFYALPMKEKILNKDETYFTNTNNHTDHFKGYDEGLDEILRLKGIWEDLDEQSKESLWDITQALLVIALEYAELKNK